MAGPGDNDRSGDIYDSAMGDDVKGASVQFDKGGSGVDHHTVYGEGRHFSWDSDRDGNVSGVHGTIHDNPNRRW